MRDFSIKLVEDVVMINLAVGLISIIRRNARYMFLFIVGSAFLIMKTNCLLDILLLLIMDLINSKAFSLSSNSM